MLLLPQPQEASHPAHSTQIGLVVGLLWVHGVCGVLLHACLLWAWKVGGTYASTCRLKLRHLQAYAAHPSTPRRSSKCVGGVMCQET
jgi:hypothetical protein